MFQKISPFSPIPTSSPVMKGASAHVFNMYDLVWELGQTEAELNFLQSPCPHPVQAFDRDLEGRPTSLSVPQLPPSAPSPC